jgi:hypothetical protein
MQVSHPGLEARHRAAHGAFDGSARDVAVERAPQPLPR